MKATNNFFSIAIIGISIIIDFAGGNIIAFSASAEEIISISTAEYSPWTGKTLKHDGFVNHVITEAFMREGYIVNYKYYPWKRNYEQAKKGRFHATSYWYKSKEREKDFYYSDSVSKEKLVFFYLKSNPMKDWNTLNDLKGYRIGATREYTYTKEFWDAAKSKRLRVDVANTDKQNFNKMLKGRIDIFPTGLVSGYSILQKDFDASISHLMSFHSKPLSETTGHLLFPRSRKNSEKLLRIFNQGLDKLKKEGFYDKFMDDLLAGKYSQ